MTIVNVEPSIVQFEKGDRRLGTKLATMPHKVDHVLDSGVLSIAILSHYQLLDGYLLLRHQGSLRRRSLCSR